MKVSKEMKVSKQTYCLVVLTLINLFHYLDRYVVSAVLEPIKLDLGLSDAQAGFLASTSFMIVFMVTAPLFGYLGDRLPRTRLIAFGVALWSAATAAAGFMRSFTGLVTTRAAVGVGEAAYATIAPTMIADSYPPERRSRALAIFYAAIPVGAALGYLVGGLVEARWGWPAVFFVAGGPGLLLAALCLTVKDPQRGRYDPPVKAEPKTNRWRQLATNRTYVWVVAGYTAYTFAIGGLAVWAPTFFHRVRGLPLAEANQLFGAILVVGGFVGTYAGGYLADWLRTKTPQADMWVSGISAALSAPLVILAVASPDMLTYAGAMFVGEILLFASTSPVNTAIINSVRPTIRATAMACSIFVIHLLGDAFSPTLIGWVSDLVASTTQPLVLATSMPAMLNWYPTWLNGAHATQQGLAMALMLVPVTLFVASACWCYLALRPKARSSAFGDNSATA